MKILLIGNGARENAIFDAYARSAHKPEIVVFGSATNPAMVNRAHAYEIGNPEDMNQVAEVAKKHNPDFAFIGPDNPIGLGAADALDSVGIKSFAPFKKSAQLESSKSFTRNLLTKYNIPGNPKYRKFTTDDAGEIETYIKNDLSEEYVVKYDGLIGGKGVKVSGEHLSTLEEGVQYAHECIEGLGNVVIEEKIVGPEFSLMSFADGKTTVAMPAVQDHKRAFDGDTGPNTGGMGTYSDANHLLPFLTQSDIDAAENITNLTLNAVNQETGELFRGIMFGGFMKTKNGIRLIEYNARFGDPEALSVLPILETDFVELSQAVINGELHNLPIKFKNKATVCLYVVPEGYPGNTSKNSDDLIIKVRKTPIDAHVFYASVDLLEENPNEYILKMSTSRALAFTGVADSIEDALEKAKLGLATVTGKISYRTDIGTKELIQKRIDLVNSF